MAAPSDQPRRSNPVLATFMVIAILGLTACALLMSVKPTRAAPAQPTGERVELPAGRKLVNASWHCFPGGSHCQLWHLTRAMRPGEHPEERVFATPEGRSITFVESHLENR